VCGALVNGPYCLITTAVSADLGTHPSLHGNKMALATVTAIIDGTGSMGQSQYSLQLYSAVLLQLWACVTVQTHKPLLARPLAGLEKPKDFVGAKFYCTDAVADGS